MIYTRYLLDFFGALRRKEEVDIGFPGQSCAYQKQKVAWALGHYMTYLKLFLLNYGGDSEPQLLFGQISCGINTAKS